MQLHEHSKLDNIYFCLNFNYSASEFLEDQVTCLTILGLTPDFQCLKFSITYENKNSSIVLA